MRFPFLRCPPGLHSLTARAQGTSSTRAHFIKHHFRPNFTLLPILLRQRKQNARCSLRPLPQERFIHYSKKTSRHLFKPKYPQPGLSCHRTKCWLVFSSLLMLAYHLPAQPTPISFPSSQAYWNLNFKWMPSMATIDKKGAFDCSCVAEKKGGDSSWLRPSRNSSSTAPLPLQWDA